MKFPVRIIKKVKTTKFFVSFYNEILNLNKLIIKKLYIKIQLSGKRYTK